MRSRPFPWPLPRRVLSFTFTDEVAEDLTAALEQFDAREDAQYEGLSCGDGSCSYRPPDYHGMNPHWDVV